MAGKRAEGDDRAPPQHRDRRAAHRRPGVDRRPLDGTREFSEEGRRDWAVHVALWVRDGNGGSSRPGRWRWQRRA